MYWNKKHRKTDTIVQFIDKIKSIFKWENEIDDLHLTLNYLGSITNENIDLICDKLTEMLQSFPSFKIDYEKTGVFKNIHSPRVLWVGVDYCQELKKLRDLISDCLKDLSITENCEITYTPHTTIGKLKWVDQQTTINRYIDEFATKRISYQNVEEIYLFKILKNEESSYEVICSIPLKNNP
ncbi:MAG: RNA 2',3'-cyclic phosphodiesterase [Bacteroidales bacterium]|nr:RNA 2',3'-cyclic phosphodiesterase [Bacteroidales bacterium]